MMQLSLSWWCECVWLNIVDGNEEADQMDGVKKTQELMIGPEMAWMMGSMPACILRLRRHTPTDFRASPSTINLSNGFVYYHSAMETNFERHYGHIGTVHAFESICLSRTSKPRHTCQNGWWPWYLSVDVSFIPNAVLCRVPVIVLLEYGNRTDKVWLYVYISRDECTPCMTHC